MFGETLETIIQASNASITANDGDYIGDDGLLYCGNCHTRKQTEIIVLGMPRRPMCLCKCAQEKKEQEEKRQKEIEFERRVKQYRRMGFPESEMQHWTFENDDGMNEKLTNAMRNYANGFITFKKQGKGLLLYGSVGTGKTYAACEVANDLISRGIPALATNFIRLTNTIQGHFDKRQEYIDGLNDFELLVLDDLGVERDSKYMQEMVYYIIDGRYRANLPMIITTNLSIEQIKKADNIEQIRIYDRILERCFPIEVVGNSRRRKMVRDSYTNMKDALGL